MAETVDADVVCLSRRRRSHARETLFGSVTQGVLHRTDRPVLVCSAGE